MCIRPSLLQVRVGLLRAFLAITVAGLGVFFLSLLRIARGSRALTAGTYFRCFELVSENYDLRDVKRRREEYAQKDTESPVQEYVHTPACH